MSKRTTAIDADHNNKRQKVPASSAVVVDLSQVGPNMLKDIPFPIITGTISSLNPYNVGTKLFTIRLKHDFSSDLVSLTLKGNWAGAEEVAKVFRHGQRVMIDASQAEVKEKPAKWDAMKREYYILFSKGMLVWTVDRDDSEDKTRYEWKQEITARPKPNTTSKKENVATTSKQAAPATLFDDDDNTSSASDAEMEHASEPSSSVPLPNSSNGSSLSSQPSRPTPQPLAPSNSSSESKAASVETEKVKKSQRAMKREREAKMLEAEETDKKVKMELEAKTWGFAYTRKVNGKEQEISIAPLSTLFDTPSNKLTFMGVLASVIQLPAPNSKDVSVTVQMRDPSTQKAVEVEMKAAETKLLPAAQPGDVIFFNNVNKNNSNKAYSSVVCYQPTPYPFLRFSDLLNPAAPEIQPTGLIGLAHIAYAKRLAKWWTESGIKVDPVVVAKVEEKPAAADLRAKSKMLTKGGGGGRPLHKIEEMQVGVFCDAIVVLSRSFVSNSFGYNDVTTIHVTDYTENPLLFNRDLGDGNGPYGQRALQVSLFGKQGEPIRTITRQCKEKGKETPAGTLLYLRNLRIKIGDAGFLEGTMIEDSKYPDKRDVSVALKTHPRAIELAEREKDYWKVANKQKNDLDLGITSTLELDLMTRVAPAVPHNVPTSHVACSKVHIPVSTVAAAIAAPTGSKHHLRGRIVDFKPDSLAEWVVAQCPECRVIVPEMLVCCEHHHRETQVAMNFRLAVRGEEAGAGYILVDVTPSDWISILPNFVPTIGMRDRNESLDPLRQRLACVLGKIEEKKQFKQKVLKGDCGDVFDLAVTRKENGQWSFVETCFVGA